MCGFGACNGHPVHNSNEVSHNFGTGLWQVCVALVRSRVDTGTGTVLAAMLEATRMQETSGKQHFSGSF